MACKQIVCSLIKHKHRIYVVKFGLVYTVLMGGFYKSWKEVASAALVTVIAVHDQTVGATLNKCANSVGATTIGVFMGYGANIIGDQLGTTSEIAVSFIIVVFLMIVREIEFVKSQLDSGVSSLMMAVLTQITRLKLLGIALGVALCLVMSFLPPVFAKDELNYYIVDYMDSLASFYQGLKELLKEGEFEHGAAEAFIESHKRVIESKEKDSSMINFAVWESFRFPCDQYKKIGHLCEKTAIYSDLLFVAILKDEPLVPNWIGNIALQEACFKMCAESEKALRSLSKSFESKKVPYSSLTKKDLSLALKLASEVENCHLKMHIPHIVYMIKESVRTIDKLVELVDELAQVATYLEPDKKGEENQGDMAIDIDSPLPPHAPVNPIVPAQPVSPPAPVNPIVPAQPVSPPAPVNPILSPAPEEEEKGEHVIEMSHINLDSGEIDADSSSKQPNPNRKRDKTKKLLSRCFTSFKKKPTKTHPLNP